MKIKFRDVILKLNDGTYFVANMISNYTDYIIGEETEINRVKGKVVGYGLKIFIIEVSE